MERNLKSLITQSVGDRLGELLAAATDVDIADALVGVVIKLKANLFAVFVATELSGNGTGFFGFAASGERGMGKDMGHRTIN